MSWFYAQANDPTGPISDEEFAQRVAQGIIQPTTLVWKEGMPQWVRYAELQPQAPPTPDFTGVPGAAPPPTAATAPVPGVQGIPAGHAQCRICKRYFPEEDLITLAGRRVCATCKPTYLQQLQEGATAWSNPTGTTSGDGQSHGTLEPEEIVQRDYDVPSVELVSSAVEWFKQDPSTLIVAGILVMLVSWAIGAAATIFQIIPLFGILVSIGVPALIKGPTMAGLVLTYLRYVRGIRVTPTDVFCGFSARFWRLALAAFAPAMLGYLCYVPAAVFGMVAGFGMATFTAGGGGAPPTAQLSVFMIGMAITFLIGAVAQTYLSVSWMYVLPLVADRHFGIRESMRLSRRVVGRHFWQHLWFIILTGIIAAIGVFACGLGVLITFPLAQFAGVLLYERVFHGLLSREPR
jgi:hypothetical protein